LHYCAIHNASHFFFVKEALRMGIFGSVRSVLPKTFSDALSRLTDSPSAAPTVKTPGFHSGATPSALSHVINTLTPDGVQRPAPVKSAPPKSSGTVFVPASAGVKGDERATQRGVVMAAVNRYYQDKGYQFSRAAIEEAAGQVELDVKNLELTYLRDAKGNMARDPSGKPIMGYYVALTPDGAPTARGASEVREADNALDAFIPEARRITEAGTTSVTDKTQMQRFEMLRQAYARRSGPDAAERLAKSFTSLENMGMLIGGTALMSTPAAPLVMAVGGYGMTKEAIEIAGLSDDIGRGLSQAERPSDIEKLTPKLDELVQRTALLTVNTVASAGLSKGANLAKTGVTTGPPTGVAVVTPEGMTFPAPSQLPVKPTGGGSPLPTIGDAAPTGLPNVTRPPGLTPPENFGGPAGRPDAMQVRGTQNATGTRRDVRAHEAKPTDPELKGHTIEKHVGKSEAWLRNRLEKDPKMKNEPFASSFRNEAIANRVQGQFVKQNRAALEAWLEKSGKGGRLTRKVEMNEPVGIVVERGKTGATVTNISVVVAVRDSSPQGWHILTSFPIPE
jgi:hypothetical protein